MKYEFRAGYRGQVAMANTNGKLFVPPLSCKDYGHDALVYQFYPKYAKAAGVTNIGASGQPSLDRPTFVLWTSEKTVGRNAEKFARVINQLEDMLGVSKTLAHPVDTGISGQSRPFVAEADGWWVKSPVAVSAYYTLLRLTIAMRLNESFDEFIERIRSYKSKVYAIQRDCQYVKDAISKDNLSGFIEKTLPCLNREGYSDYLLSGHSRGLSGYSTKHDSTYPLDEKGLIDKISPNYNKPIV